MAIIKKQTTVAKSPDELWNELFSDPNGWGQWLTPIQGIEEEVKGPARGGLSFGARVGKLSAKLKVTEASPGKLLRWKAGPPMLLLMGSGMRGQLELRPSNGGTRVDLRMVTPLMLGPMMKMMTGLNSNEEMTKTIGRIKELGDKQG